jgi:hypothetical protein
VGDILLVKTLYIGNFSKSNLETLLTAIGSSESAQSILDRGVNYINLDDDQSKEMATDPQAGDVKGTIKNLNPNQHKTSRGNMPAISREAPFTFPPVVFTIPPPMLAPPEQLAALETNVDEYRKEIALRVQQILASASRIHFPDVQTKKEFAARIQRLLNTAESRIECPKCGEPATIRASVLGKQKDGAFQFVHVKPNRTIHGGTVGLPPNLQVVPREK